MRWQKLLKRFWALFECCPFSSSKELGSKAKNHTNFLSCFLTLSLRVPFGLPNRLLDLPNFFEGLQIVIDAGQKKAICHTSMLKIPLRDPLLNPPRRGEGPSLRSLRLGLLLVATLGFEMDILGEKPQNLKRAF
jgi:hypothetical protein